MVYAVFLGERVCICGLAEYVFEDLGPQMCGFAI
jgi:hypothetical protein